MSYRSIEAVEKKCEKDGIDFWKAIQLEDCDEQGITEEASWKMMQKMWYAMRDAVDAYEPELVSRSGLVGREGGLMEAYQQAGAVSYTHLRAH